MCYQLRMLRVNSLDIPTSLADLLDPRRVALLVYDMQVGITRQIKERDSVIAKVQQVLQSARAAKVRTFFTRHMSLPRELMGAMQYRTAMAWQHEQDPTQVQSPFLRDSPGFAITPQLQPLASEAVLDKISMSAFEGTPLAMALRDCGVRAVVLVGIALEIGIEPTARHAADLGIVPILVRDACGHGNAEAAERSLQALTFAGDSVITEASAVGAIWASAAH
jgi:nicotinamidase-related amidase